MKFILLLLLLSNQSFAKIIETKTFADVEKTALEKIKKYGADNVLMVFDIDNTLLVMAQDFGSDQWFNWQYENCVKKKTKEFKNCAASNMGELLDLTGQIFALSKTNPTENKAVSVMNSLQDKGVKVMLLTSRGPNYRDATERELKINGYNPSLNTIGSGEPGSYIPYKLDKPKQYGLSKNDIDGLSKARNISFQNGVMMTAGLNKGIMLKTILHKTNSKFKSIIFVDDHARHTKRMEKVFGKDKTIDLVAYRYGHMDQAVEKFKQSDKKSAITAYQEFSSMLKKVFNK